MTRGVSSILALLPAAFLLMVSVACAREESGAQSGNPTDEIFKWIHFVILVGLVCWVFGKLLPPVFRKRADLISEAILKGTAAKEEADRQLKEAAVKLTSLEQEVAAFRAMAEKETGVELERLRNLTRTDAEKIVAAGKAEIEATERAARVALKELAARLAVDKAESLVAQQMTPGVQDALIANFVQNLEGRPN